jgi:hypothetical protein
VLLIRRLIASANNLQSTRCVNEAVRCKDFFLNWRRLIMILLGIVTQP